MVNNIVGLKVFVPATSANLGVGYDCLGLALDLEAEFTFMPSDRYSVAGCDACFVNDDNLVLTSMQRTAELTHTKPVPCAISIASPIPLAGGLGSSAACIIAGVAAQLHLTTGKAPLDACLDLATIIEGHPDNVSAAVYGGLVSSFAENDHITKVRFSVSNDLHFVAIAPPYTVSTHDARRVMPANLPLDTTVWQMGHVLGMVQGLVSGDCDLIAKAAHDKLHEPYRAPLIADYEQCRASALQAGAVAYLISGSGATMLAICENSTIANTVKDALQARVPRAWTKILSVHHDGLRIECITDPATPPSNTKPCN